MTNSKERREYLRADINIFVNEEIDGSPMLARATDISEAGMRYAKPRIPVRRTEPDVFLQFCLPGEELPLKTLGRVVCDSLDDRTHSTSVSFTALDEADVERIRQYVIRRKRAELFEQIRMEHLKLQGFQ